ncbi:hypothetical protein Tco_0039844 [Tanacetum coccineum]
MIQNPDNPDDPTAKIIEPLSKMTESNNKQYFLNIRVMNFLLQGIPNDIYNSVDACKTAKQMWERIRWLMHGSKKTEQQRHSMLVNEFDKFVVVEGESLSSVYERLTTLVNVIERNNIPNIKETKFDNLFDTLSQYEPHVIASRAKKAARNHDPLALVAHSNVHSSHSYIQGDTQEDKLTTAMMLLASAITQRYSTLTNNHLHTSSNIRNQTVIQDGRVDIQSKNVGYARNGHYARDCPQPKVRDAKYFREYMLLAMKDEAGGNLNEEENDFILDNHYGYDSLEELNTTTITDVNALQIHLKSRIHSESVHEHTNHAKIKTAINTFDDDQIDSSIIFDDPYVENNSREDEHDSNAHDQSVALESLIYNVKKEAQKQRSLNNELKKQKTLLHVCPNEFKQEITEEVQEIIDIFESMEKKVEQQSQNNKKFQNEIDRLLETSLSREIRDCVLLSVEKQKNETLMLEKEKLSNDSKDIQATKKQRIKILNIISKKMMLIFKATRVQHQQEVKKLVENVNQKTYAYGDVRAKNQDLLMTIFELKARLTEQAKNVNTKFDESTTLEKPVCVTPLNKNKDLKAKIVSKVEIKTDKSKPVTSCSTSKNEQDHKPNVNVIARSISVSRSESKDTNSKKRVLLNTKSKSTSKDVKKSHISFNSDAKKIDTMNLNVIQIFLWIVDSGCSKHMTGNLKLLSNFVEKFMGTVRFGNDNFVAITGYGDYVQDNLTICHVLKMLMGNAIFWLIVDDYSAILGCFSFKTKMRSRNHYEVHSQISKRYEG